MKDIFKKMQKGIDKFFEDALTAPDVYAYIYKHRIRGFKRIVFNMFLLYFIMQDIILMFVRLGLMLLYFPVWLFYRIVLAGGFDD